MEKGVLICDTAISVPLRLRTFRPAGRMGMSPSFGKPAHKKKPSPIASDGSGGSSQGIPVDEDGIWDALKSKRFCGTLPLAPIQQFRMIISVPPSTRIAMLSPLR